MEVNRPPLEIMPYLKYTMADYIPSSSKKRRVVILDDPAWLSWHFATIKIFGTDEISFLEPPYLFNGKPVLFKSGENGEGPMMSGTFIELWYCDQWGTPYRDPLRKFPWKYVKLSRYLGDLLHHGTNARIIDDSGKEHLIGGRWIFPGHDKDKGERPQEKDDGISPDSWLDEKIKDAQTESQKQSQKDIIPPLTDVEPELIPSEDEKIAPEETEKEEIIVPPEEIIVPPLDEEIIVPPEEEEELVPSEEDEEVISPPSIFQRKKKKKKKKVAITV